MTYGSCHRMWLSNVHTWVNPYCSARLARSTTRADGGVVCSTTPKSTMHSPLLIDARLPV